MPIGRIQRIDDNRELVYVVHRGRTYAAPVGEVEPAARIPSARVRFDLVRDRGSERAANVRLRTGTRTNKRQRRFADLTGARRPGAKVATIANRSLGIDVATQPFRVARAWLAALADDDPDGATALYLPGARLHAESGTSSGRREIRAELGRQPGRGIDVDGSEISGLDRYVRVDFTAADGPKTTYLEIDRGAIVEQWLGTEPPVEAPPQPAGEAEVVRRGRIPDGADDYARGKLAHLVERAGQPVRYTRIKLTMAENPVVERPAMAELTVELDDGELLRAHRAAATFGEATDLAMDRLAAIMEHRRDRHRHDPTGTPAEPGGWRHGNLTREPRPYFDRPVEERELVRHKSFAPESMTVEEAEWDMDLLDYDFFLFVDSATGGDTMLERADDGPPVLHRLDPPGEPPPSGGAVLSSLRPPELEVSAALELLRRSGERWLFFRNRTTGRGNVVYHRYDGHDGLITPPAAAT